MGTLTGVVRQLGGQIHLPGVAGVAQLKRRQVARIAQEDLAVSLDVASELPLGGAPLALRGTGPASLLGVSSARAAKRREASGR